MAFPPRTKTISLIDYSKKDKDIYILEDETIKDKNNVRNILIRYIFTNNESVEKVFNAKVKQRRNLETQVKKNCYIVTQIKDRVKSNQSTCFWCLKDLEKIWISLKKMIF